MKTLLSSACTKRGARRTFLALTCAVAMPWLVLAPAALGGTATAPSTSVSQAVADAGASASTGQSPPAGSKAIASATLQQCATATIPQTERSATFAGEMSMIPGATRMSMRIELLERMPGETGYRAVQAPGLGVWRAADPGVKSYKHLEQVTNLAAPAVYRALVSFRWQGPRGRVLRHDERRTPRCSQPAPPPPPAPPASPPLE
jgi:hypothetical protein